MLPWSLIIVNRPRDLTQAKKMMVRMLINICMMLASSSKKDGWYL